MEDYLQSKYCCKFFLLELCDIFILLVTVSTVVNQQVTKSSLESLPEIGTPVGAGYWFFLNSLKLKCCRKHN